MAKQYRKNLGQFLSNPPQELVGWTPTEMIDANVTMSYMLMSMVGRWCTETELKRLDHQNKRLNCEILPDWSHLFCPINTYRESCYRLMFGEKYSRGLEKEERVTQQFEKRRGFMDEAIERLAYIWGYHKTFRSEIWALEIVVLRPKLSERTPDIVSRAVFNFPSIVNIKKAIAIINRNNLIVEANARCIHSKSNLRLINSAEFTTQAWRQAAVVEPRRTEKGRKLQAAFAN